MKQKNGITVDDVPTPNVHIKTGKNRRFILRRKYMKWKRTEARKKNIGLIHNFSDLTLSNHMISLLNRGPGFVPVEKSVNTSQIMAELERYNRSMKWSLE